MKMKMKMNKKIIFPIIILFAVLFQIGCSSGTTITLGDNMKGTKVFQNYFKTDSNNKLYGLESSGFVDEIELIDVDGEPCELLDFFKKGDDLYFHVNEITGQDDDGNILEEKFYKQNGTTISEVSKIPTKPELGRVQLDDVDFTITNFTWEENLMSDIENKKASSGLERFYEVNGFGLVEDKGLWFHVKDGRYGMVNGSMVIVRENGLYFWNIDRTSPDKRLDIGEMW